MGKKLLFILILFTPFWGFSQSLEADNYESEFIWGVNKNTAGGLIGGLVARKSKRLSDRMYQSYGLELMNVKHERELRITSNQGGGQFIYGKSNYLYAIRLQYGRELVLFRKAPEQGVEIKAIGAIGPSIGLLTPYYISYYNDQGNSNLSYAPYTPDVDISKIYGSGRIFQGLFESQVRIGANLKAGLSFELGSQKSHVTGFEVGFLLDAYAGEVELMPAYDNSSVFPTAFITLFYGKRR
ncbi:hypothetical protein [Fulvivirga sediminis]|uniref:Outer membrane protein beta-barrel domain-containing protein n=1 Tax=Fulvivirga sediminis TaxID=2803949 RepID=A0A937F7A0_9BACT|nr:hypothetical protein [Fulvivirga sediminis]MBL3657050.1 hypothetical protein [Fulvivirga sediminis]